MRYLRYLRPFGLLLLLLIVLSGLCAGTILTIITETILRWFGV